MTTDKEQKHVERQKNLKQALMSELPQLKQNKVYFRLLQAMAKVNQPLGLVL